MMSVTPSSSKPPDPLWDYDVYVSFIGDKTSYDFLYYLFGGLERNGIVTFRQPPPRGENIPTLAIQRSRIFMVVLSQDYVSSEYCLNELAEIVHHKNIKDHIFFPILYRLGPSDVQKRIETLEEAFPRPEGQFGTGVDQGMQGWRAALTEAMNSSDRKILHDDAIGSMGILKFVEEVLDEVCSRLNIPRNILRMDSCVEMMTDSLNLGTSEIYIVGMSCVDETLKETLLEVLYDQIVHGFERTSFISNISEISIDLFGLQEQLLDDMILGGNKVNIKNADEGISLIEEAIQGKRILIVLDGVADLKQLNSLVGNSKCFGPGSRVIAISRDKQLRTELEAQGKHKVEDLHNWKSQLFIWRASMMAHSAEDFSDKIKFRYLQRRNENHDYDRVYLNQKRQKFNPDANLGMSEGEGNEKQLTLEPNEEVVLDNEPFDISGYYVPAQQTLDLSGTSISSLPKSIFGLVGLKRLILRGCSYFKELPPEVGELKQLEVLDLEGTPTRDLPENLRCPMLLELYLHNNKELSTIPSSFFKYMPALQILNLSKTRISSLPKSIVRVVSLKKLILRGCYEFTELPPEVEELKQLEVLDLEGVFTRDLPENLRCPMLLELYLHNNYRLSTIPPSFFNYMPALQVLNLSKTCISSLPESIDKLVSLKKLILRGCSKFKELPPEVELKQLEVLDLEGANIRDLPENLRCPMLLELYLHNNYGLSTIPPSFFNYMPALQVLNLSETFISSLPESIDKLVSLKILILSSRLLSKVGDLKRITVINTLRGILELHERVVIDLEGKGIMDLSAENPSHPESLLAVFLNNNHKLKTIPSSFFDFVPVLQVLNLSRTGIRSLPESIFRLVSLKILILSYCHRFLRLSPKVGELGKLEVLDLEGTEIMGLPEEIMNLRNLTCLKFSIYGYIDDGSSVMESDPVVPRGIISKLVCLEELMISVNPDDKRWNACVEDIVTEVCILPTLNTLLFYFPRVELVSRYLLERQPWVSLSNPRPSHFRFIVGHHVKRIMSRRPRDVELELERWAKCLEYINGDQAIPEVIKTVLKHSTAFFLERHATVKKLSGFGIKNMKHLNCCVVGECNEVEVIIDETDAHKKDVVLGSLEYLCIYYMKNLKRIWEGPVQPKSLSLLKFLTLRTCPQLTTIFTINLLDNLCYLEELTIDDCPSIKTLVSCEVSTKHKTSHFLPNLKRIVLHFMPGLVSISSGLHIAPRLEWLSFYNCPNLMSLLIEEVSSKDLKKIEGERSWWEALEWSTDRPACLDDIFVPINIEDY